MLEKERHVIIFSNDLQVKHESSIWVKFYNQHLSLYDIPENFPQQRVPNENEGDVLSRKIEGRKNQQTLNVNQSDSTSVECERVNKENLYHHPLIDLNNNERVNNILGASKIAEKFYKLFQLEVLRIFKQFSGGFMF